MIKLKEAYQMLVEEQLFILLAIAQSAYNIGLQSGEDNIDILIDNFTEVRSIEPGSVVVYFGAPEDMDVSDLKTCLKYLKDQIIHLRIDLEMASL